MSRNSSFIAELHYTRGNRQRATTNPLDEALKILTITPSRVGDALAILLALPPDLAGSELALRLKSLLFGQLGYADDFDAATARLTPLK